MNNKFLKVISAKQTTLILLVVYAVLMAVATLIEKYYTTPVAKALVYYSPLFILLQALLVVNFIGVTVRYHLVAKRKTTYLLLHLALVVILGGAFTTHLFGKEGMLHLREGATTNELILKKGDAQQVEKLPFDIELIDFKLTRYPGSQSPSSYESIVKIHKDNTSFSERIYMNNVLDLEGYRFYQASYDQDEKGSILAVNYDFYGRIITYFGYLLLFAAIICMLIDKNSRFRRLWQQVKRATMMLLLLLASHGLTANAQELSIPEKHAELFGTLPVQLHNGRIVPVHTFASEIVRKFDIQKQLGSLSPVQFLVSLLAYPSDWAVIPLIEIDDDYIAQNYGWQKGRISYREAFNDAQQYKLYKDIEEIYRKNPALRTRTDKELMKIDDRINILHSLLSHHMPRLFPIPSDTLTHRWVAPGEVLLTDAPLTPSEKETIGTLAVSYFKSIQEAGKSQQWQQADSLLQEITHYQQTTSQQGLINQSKLQTEVYYNQLNLAKWCRMGYLIMGGLLLIVTFIGFNSDKKASWRRVTQRALVASILLFFCLHTLNLGMRWYISGYAPWSNSYETMVTLAWAGVLGGFIFYRRNLLVTALATLFGGSVLFVSGLSWMDPQITPLVPVLKSPWLMSHVASLVMAYGFLGISCMIGTTYLILSLSKKTTVQNMLKQLTMISELSMILGTGLLSIGIFLGAIWANESWGRYWSWDPKETWALITLVVYATVLHFRWFASRNADKLFNWFAQLAFLAILMTFLGVNYFLSGMHSYGSHDALAGIPFWAYLLFFTFFMLPGLLSLVFGKSNK